MSNRRIALQLLQEITQNGAYANLSLKQAVSGLPPRDARWVTAAVYETLDHLLYIDHVLSHFIHGRQKPVIRGVLRLGVCELLYLHTPVSAACNETVKLTKEIGKGALSGYVNGVLRSVARAKAEDALPPLPEDPVERLSIQYSWPAPLVREWLSDYGEAACEQMLQAPQPPMTIRAQWPCSASELAQELAQRGIACTPGEWEPDCLLPQMGWDVSKDPLFLQGKLTVQSQSAALVCRACGVKPGMRVLDLCAAPGGKSACLWSLSRGQCELSAWELHPHRRELLDKTLQRLHVTAHTEQRDATVWDPALSNAFDVVLADVPCSGLGVTGKPDIRYRKTEEDIAALCAVQKQILHTAAGYVKPGGVLLYATCTVSRRENQQQVEAFLSEHREFSLSSLAELLPAGLPGAAQGMVQLLPHRDHTEGFFMARLERCKA